MANVIDQVKEATDLVDLIGEHVPLKRSGRTLVGFCPFHPNTRTPAFTVFPDTQSFHCFGCKANGSVFDFLMRREGLEFTEALRVLADRAGIQLKQRTEAEEQEDAYRSRLYDILAATARFWTHLLLQSPKGAAARTYLEERGITLESMQQFQLGFAPTEWSATLAYLNDRLNATPHEVQAAGLALEREHGGFFDRFRSRIMFPIHDPRGHIVGFGGRALGAEQPKYMNSPQSIVFDKSSLLYGLYHGRDALRAAEHVVVVEGYMDVIMAHQHGYRNVVAPMGTALTDEHAGQLNKLVQRITLAMDGDAAGRTAVLRGLDTLRENLDSEAVLVPSASGALRWQRELHTEISIAVLPPNRDPDDIIRHNPVEWAALIHQASPLMDFYITTLTSDLDLSSARGKASAVERIAPLISEIGDQIIQTHYIQQLATLINVPERIVAEAVQPKHGRQRASISRTPPPPPREVLAALEQESRREDYLLALLLQNDQVRAVVHEDLRDDLASSPALRELWNGELSELFERTENRVLWELWRSAGPGGPADLDQWVESLLPELQHHYHHLCVLAEQPQQRFYKVTREAQECLRPLRRRLAQRWNQRIGHLIAVAEPADQERLLEQAMALNSYLRTSSEPRRSTYFQDSRDSLKY